MVCVMPPHLKTLHGLQTLQSFPYDAVDIQLGMVFAGIVMFTLGVRTLVRRPLNQPPPPPGAPPAPLYLRWIIAAYAWGTALFAWSRAYWDTSKMLLCLAATHNMFEWMLISHLYLKDEFLLRQRNRPTDGATVQKGMAASYKWIWFVITVTVSLPFIAAVLFEQVTGIACDYILIITFIWFAFIERNQPQPKKTLWRLGFLASLFHFGQIWPLVIGTFGLSGTAGRINEWVLIFSAGLTFYYYSEFALKWEELYYRNFPPAGGPPDGGEDGNENNHGHADDEIPARTTNMEGRCVVIVVVGLLLGIATIFGPRLLFGQCPTPQLIEHGSDGAVTGFTLVHAKSGQGKALKSELTEMLPLVRKEPGSISYELYTTSEPDSLLVIEKWANIQALTYHVRSSAAVKGIWRSRYVKGMMANETLAGPWFNVDPTVPPQTGEVAFNFEVEMNINKVWKVLNNWKDCSWVQGCKGAVLLTENRRIMDMGATELDVARVETQEEYTLIYEIIRGANMFTHYTGTIRLVPTPGGGGTTASYTSSFCPAQAVKLNEAVAFVRQDFEDNRIPFLKKRFGNKRS